MPLRSQRLSPWFRVVGIALLGILHACDGPDLVVGELSADAAVDADVEAGQALPCTSNAMCEGGEPECNVAEGRCVECLSTDHCATNEHPLCNVARGECVDCLDTTDCENGLFCQLPEGECEDSP